MGTVLELRLSGSGDWTAQERDQLQELIDRLPPDPDREVVFGLTDAGDPWCVVLDGDDEVVIHVARINGLFVVHVARENLVFEAPTLWTAAARFGVELSEPRPANVVSLHGDALPAHVLAALAIAQPALSQTLVDQAPGLRPIETAPQGPNLHATAVLTVAPLEALPTVAPQAAVVEDAPAPTQDAPLSVRAPEPDQNQPPVVIETPRVFAPAAATVSAPPSEIVIAAHTDAAAFAGAAGDETLVGTAGADTLVGGDGDDLIDGRGAGQGEIDLLDGGAGDDRVVMGENVVANGGAGNDRFLIGPAPGPGGGHSLGIVMDFFQSREDRLDFGPGANVRVVTISTEDDVLAAVRNRGVPGGAPVVGGARVGLDFDGDGQADGFVLLGNVRFGQGAATPAEGAGTAREGRLPDFLENAGFRPDFLTGQAPPRIYEGAVNGFVGGSSVTAFQIDPTQFAGRPEPSLHAPAMAPPVLEDSTHLEALPWV